MADVARLAARRLAAQRRNARRLADAEEEEEEARGGGGDAGSTSLRLVGTVYDADDARTGASAAAVASRQIQSAHDQRRAINARIYGRLNVVEDEKGFAPKAFVSSRNARAGAAAAAASAAGGAGAGGGAATASESTGGRYPVQRVQDFMDEEDLGESGAAGADAVHSGLTARSAFGPSGSGSGASAGAATAAVGELAAPASSQSIALKLLQAMGWRAGGHNGSNARSKKKAKVYGAALPPSMRMDSSTDADAGADEDADVSEVSDAVAFARIMEGGDSSSGHGTDVPVYSSRQKNDTYGVGFVPYSQLSQAARARHDQAYAPLTFVRAKHASASPDALSLTQPREYRIEVPADFDGRHHFPLHEAAAPRGPPVVHAWQGRMDAARRGQLLGERTSEAAVEPPQQQQQQQQPPPRTLTSLPLPPPLPPGAFAAASAAGAPPAAAPAATHTPGAPTSGMSALDLQRQRRLEAIALAEQGGGGRPPSTPFSAPSFAAPAAPGPPRIDIQAAIAAATAKAAAMLAEKEREQKKNERRAKWGPLPPEAVQAAAASSSSFPLAAAFLSANFGAPVVEAPPTAHASLPLPPMPPSAHATESSMAPSSAPPAAATAAAAAPTPSLALAFPNFVVAGEIDASGASSAASTDTTAASSTSGVMGNFVPASSSSASAAASSSSATAPAVPTGPFAEYFAAAKMKMYGKLTRRIEEWTPHSLVYRRLGVPVPSHVRNAAAAQQRAKGAAARGAGGNAASTGAAVPGFPSFVQASTPFGSVADPAAAAAASGLPAAGASAGGESLAAAMAEMARDEEAAIQAQLARDDEELYGSNEGNMAGAAGAGTMGDGSGGWTDVTHAAGQGEPAAAAVAAAPDAKPSLDLFKAIFEASSDEEEELRHKQPARRAEPSTAPLPVQPPPTSTPPPQVQVVRSAGPTGPPPSAIGGAAAAAPPSSSGFVHPDRLRLVPSSGGSLTPAPAPAPARAAASSAHARPAPPPAHREVISLDDSDEDMAGGGDVHITGFGAGQQQRAQRQHAQPHRKQAEEKKFAPSSFLHSKNSLQFVPASGKPPAQTGRSSGAALAARGHRFGMSGPPEDDEDDGYTPAGFATLGRALQPLGGSGGGGNGGGGMDELHGLDRSQRFVPPPVQPPRAPVQLPPAVHAAWPFASPLAHAHAQESSAPRPAFAAAPAPPASSASASTPAPGSSSDDASSALLSQLLDLQRAHKASKKHKKHRDKDKERKEKKHKEKKDKKRSSSDKDRKEKKHKRERKRSSRSSRRRRDSDSSGTSSSGSSSDSDTSVRR